MKRLANQYSVGLKQRVQDSFKLFAALLRRQIRPEQSVEGSLRDLDFCGSFLPGASGLFDRDEARLTLLIVGPAHACEGVFQVYDFSNTGYEPLLP